MLDYQRIVDDARNSIYTASVDGVDFLRAAAADYMVACDEVNERLQRCGTLLRQGLRSEALQLADISPVLLEVVATLDFPEREQWCQIISQFGIVTPPPLAMDVASELNDAYATEQPLSSLLNRHRLMALGCGSLKQRTEVLRQLAELDVDNPIWRDDLAEFERERQRQLQQEVADALAAENLDSLASLNRELKDTGWQEAPSVELRAWTNDAWLRLSTCDARNRMEQLVIALNQAFSEFDTAAGRAAREEWYTLLAAASNVADDILLEQAAPALEWLAQQDENDACETGHRDALAALERAIEQNRPRDVLERAYHAASRTGLGVPAQIERLYRSRIASLELAGSRRSRLILVGLVVGSLAIGTAVAIPIYLTMQSRQVASNISALEKLIVEGKLTEAEKFAEGLAARSPAIAAQPQIANLMVRLTGLKQQEGERLHAFHSALTAAETAGVDDPDLRTVERAEKLAKTEAELEQVSLLRAQIDSAQIRKRKSRESHFLDEMQRLAAALAELEKSSSMQPQDYGQAIEALRREVNTLKQEHEDLSNDLLVQTRPIVSRLDALAMRANLQLELQESEMAITKAVGDRSKFSNALKRFSDRFPDAPQASAFRQVQEQAATWEQIDDWNDFLAKWDLKSRETMGPAEARALADAIRRFCKSHPRWPSNSILQKRLDYLDAIAQRVTDGQPLHDSLEQLFTDSLVADLWQIVLSDGRCFYCRTQPAEGNNGLIQFKYLTGFELAEKSRAIKGDEVKNISRAPQVALAAQLSATLGNLGKAGWEDTFVALVSNIKDKAKDSELEPLLSLRLLQQTLDIGGKGSYAFATAFESELKLARSSKVNATANWLDPDDAEARACRPIARQELAAMGDFATAERTLAELVRAGKSPLGKSLQWVGWLKRANHRGWSCEAPGPITATGKLFVIVTSGDKIALPVIGRIKPNQTVEIVANSAELIDGRPIYLATP